VKKILVIILTVLAIAYVVAYSFNVLPKQVSDVTNSIFQTGKDKLPQLQESLDKELIASRAAELSERGGQVLETTSDVLNNVVAVDESQPEGSLTDRAITYGRYLYCKQVVEDWEKTATKSGESQTATDSASE